jgi:hypothetical protein
MSNQRIGLVVGSAALVSLGLVIGRAPSFAQSRAPHVMPIDRPPPVTQQAGGFNGCNGPDCVPFDLSTQMQCEEQSGQPTSDMRWVNGLSLAIDNQVLGGDIVAYRLQWSNGQWSGYYVPGVNDIDYKFNPQTRTMRRMWSYFYDHAFSYIICR